MTELADVMLEAGLSLCGAACVYGGVGCSGGNLVGSGFPRASFLSNAVLVSAYQNLIRQ